MPEKTSEKPTVEQAPIESTTPTTEQPREAKIDQKEEAYDYESSISMESDDIEEIAVTYDLRIPDKDDEHKLDGLELCSPLINSETLDAMNSLENLQPFLIKVKSAFQNDGKLYIEYCPIPEGFTSLQSIIELTAEQPLQEVDIKAILHHLLELTKRLAGMIWHLDPDSIYFSSDLKEVKVKCGCHKMFNFVKVEQDEMFQYCHS